MPFGEYELSPSLIGLSLLHTPHREAFQRLSVGPSIPCYRDFSLDMCRSLGFASATTDYKRPLQARFHCGYAAPTACRRMVSGTISLPSSGCFSPFPHGTRSLSVSREYLALPDGPGRFAQDYSCPALLRIPLGSLSLHVRGFHPLWPAFPGRSVHDQESTPWSYNPGHASLHARFGLFPVRSPLLGESLVYFLFLRVLRCFSSPG